MSLGFVPSGVGVADIHWFQIANTVQTAALSVPLLLAHLATEYSELHSVYRMFL